MQTEMNYIKGRHDTQHRDTPHNGTQHIHTCRNDIQQNVTQHKHAQDNNSPYNETMDKLKLTGRNLGRVFNSRPGRDGTCCPFA